MSILNFMDQYGSEKKCRSALFRFRWPKGFVCPKCGNKTYCEIKKRNVFQCHRCHFQTSVTAGTIFHSSNLPLTKWFLAMFLMTQGKKLSRRIGASCNATWSLKHKLMQVMLEQDSTKKLTGRIEIDDSYLGGKRAPSKRGRGATGKSPFVATIETHDGRPYLMKLSRIKGFQLTEIARWSNHHLSPHSNVVPDGLACFKAVEKANRSHERHVVGGGKKAKKAVEHPSFKWVNTILGKLKNSLRGTFHTFQEKHIPRYLAESLQPDHVHILILIPPKYSVSQVVGYMKGKSAIHIARTYFDQKKNYIGMHFWARGFLFQQLVPMRKL